MNFREFYEARNYAVVKRDDGGFQVNGPYNKVWPVSIDKGELILPPELEPERDKIVSAYFHRDIFKPFHKPSMPQLPQGDTLEPSPQQFHPTPKTKKSPNDQSGTINYTPS